MTMKKAEGQFTVDRLKIMLRRKTNDWLICLAAIWCLAYVSAYVALSRRGFAVLEQFGSPGFYYFPAENTDSWRFCNGFCQYLFWPLNQIDCAIGTGRGTASEPLWDISFAAPNRAPDSESRATKLSKATLCKFC